MKQIPMFFLCFNLQTRQPFANRHSYKVLKQSNEKLFETVFASIEKLKHVQMFFWVSIK